MGLHVPPEATEKALRIPRAGSAELLNLISFSGTTTPG